MALASTIELPERYRVARHIASGGMASVWEAEDLLLGRIVAVKVLGAQFAADPSARARFQREARTAAQVSDQSHVVTIYDIGEHGTEAFIVMEYFAGGTVADRLRAARDAGERVPRETALRWLREAADGIDVAHAAGIVHRDVKPANLLLDAQDRLAVADFGIARLADDTQMTQTGQVLGTAAYISPEQALGQPATAASDRYALAVVAYELLTGQRPFSGGPPTAQALQHVREQPSPASENASDLPAGVDAVLARGLAKDPAERPATASELVEGLDRALAQTAPTPAVAAPPIEPTRKAPPAAPVGVPLRPQAPRQPAKSPPAAARAPQRRPASARRRPSPAIFAAVVFAGAIVALVLALSSGNDPRSNAGGDGASKTSTKPAAGRTTATPAADPAPPPPPPPPVAAAKPSGDPATLNSQGDNLIKAGNYAEAVEPLRAAVAAYEDAGNTSGLPYAFALYNLAVALNRSGNPQEAIPLLEKRLSTSSNQRGTVRKELADAQSRLDGGAGDAGKAKKNNDD